MHLRPPSFKAHSAWLSLPRSLPTPGLPEVPLLWAEPDLDYVCDTKTFSYIGSLSVYGFSAGITPHPNQMAGPLSRVCHI